MYFRWYMDWIGLEVFCMGISWVTISVFWSGMIDG